MSVENIKQFLVSPEVLGSDQIWISKSDLQAIIRHISSAVFACAQNNIIGLSVNKIEKSESESESELEPIFIDGSKFKSRAFNDRYMTVENVKAALKTFSETEILATDVATRVVTHVIPSSQRKNAFEL